ncbi:MAG: FoF1 ATP synthase subunit delta/epsilon, partial [Bacteroidota bacterium]
LEIITPDKKVYAGDVTSVSVPGTDGRFQLLEMHAPIISTLLNGTVKVMDKEGEKLFEVKGGVIENLDNKVIILAEAV